jgi:hypothetical protein
VIMIGEKLETIWAPRVLGIVRVASTLIFM